MGSTLGAYAHLKVNTYAISTAFAPFNDIHLFKYLAMHKMQMRAGAIIKVLNGFTTLWEDNRRAKAKVG